MLTKESFKQIFDLYFDTVRNYIFYRSGDTELATDICQEAFMKIWEKQFNNDKKQIKALVFKIAGDLLITHYRKQKTVLKFNNSFDTQQEDRSPEEEYEFNELKLKYEKALSYLS